MSRIVIIFFYFFYFLLGQECENIEYSYDQLHGGFYSECEFNIDCMAVWGHCDVGLGGCHYAINEGYYDSMQVETLVNMWIEDECASGVCDCTSLPNVQCIDGYCELAYCYNENPEGCFSSGCSDEYECINDPNYCVPSSCFCSGDFYGEWFCDDDCSGGTCIEIENILPGDINEDTILNILDIVLMINMVLSNEYSIIADVNEDEVVDILDVVIMVNILVGGLP
jgi:hypothetical protein